MTFESNSGDYIFPSWAYDPFGSPMLSASAMNQGAQASWDNPMMDHPALHIHDDGLISPLTPFYDAGSTFPFDPMVSRDSVAGHGPTPEMDGHTHDPQYGTTQLYDGHIGTAHGLHHESPSEQVESIDSSDNSPLLVPEHGERPMAAPPKSSTGSVKREHSASARTASIVSSTSSASSWVGPQEMRQIYFVSGQEAPQRGSKGPRKRQQQQSHQQDNHHSHQAHSIKGSKKRSNSTKSAVALPSPKPTRTKKVSSVDRKHHKPNNSPPLGRRPAAVYFENEDWDEDDFEDKTEDENNDGDDTESPVSQSTASTSPLLRKSARGGGTAAVLSAAPEARRMRNRAAAAKCRRKSKAAIEELEDTSRLATEANEALSATMTMLKDQVLGLKNEVLRHSACGCVNIEEYLKRAARDVSRGEGAGAGSVAPSAAASAATAAAALGPTRRS